MATPIINLVVKPAGKRSKEIGYRFEAKSAAELFARLMDVIGYVWTARENQADMQSALRLVRKLPDTEMSYDITFGKIPTDPDALDEFCGAWWTGAGKIFKTW